METLRGKANGPDMTRWESAGDDWCVEAKRGGPVKGDAGRGLAVCAAAAAGDPGRGAF